MKLGMYTTLFGDKPLDEVARYAAELGYQALELPAWKGNTHLCIDDVLQGGAAKVKRVLDPYGLEISAINNALEGQLVLGPLDRTTDCWSPSERAEEKVKYGTERMIKTAQAASELGVPVVTGFVGSHVWDKWYIFPPANEEEYERGWLLFAERWGKILDEFARYGVKFALEVHPTEIAYNIETAERAVEALGGRPEFGFNFDPSHLVWQLIDPVVFIKRLGKRIYHAHAKDGELQRDEVGRSGVIPTGGWLRMDRGFRFRVPGWGDVDWRRVITALASVGYDYVLSFEHEDPVMSAEDGAEKAIDFLKPLIIRKALRQVWW